MLEWATEQIKKDTEQEADDFLTKLELVKPWLDLQLWNHIKKQEDKFEEKKSIVASTLGVNPSKINVKNSFEDTVKKLGLPQNVLDELLGNKNG